jgi:hypothetical protein
MPEAAREKARMGFDFQCKDKTVDFCNVQVPRQVHRIRPLVGGRQLLASSNRSASRILLCVFVDEQVPESEDSVVKSHRTKNVTEIPKRGQKLAAETLGVMMEKNYCELQLANEEYEI